MKRRRYYIAVDAPVKSSRPIVIGAFTLESAQRIALHYFGEGVHLDFCSYKAQAVACRDAESQYTGPVQIARD